MKGQEIEEPKIRFKQTMNALPILIGIVNTLIMLSESAALTWWRGLWLHFQALAWGFAEVDNGNGNDI